MIIGITGRMGSGKSQAAAILKKEFRCRVIDLDKIGHIILRRKQIKNALLKRFGDTILNESNTIDRGQLGKIVFSDPRHLRLLNTLTHPLIQHAVKKRIDTHTKTNPKTTLLIVGALIEEIGLKPFCDTLIVIDVPDTYLNPCLGEKTPLLTHQKTRQQYQTIADHIIENRYDPAFKSRCIATLKPILNE